jgi:AraC-like DNA-binding protein
LGVTADQRGRSRRGKRAGAARLCRADGPAPFDRKELEFIIEHYVRECFARKESVRSSELSARLRLSRQYVSAAVAQILGRTVSAVIRELQVKEASRLLRTTSLPVAEIHKAAGFGDKTNFFRAFKAAVGMTPSQYRRATKTRQIATSGRDKKT